MSLLALLLLHAGPPPVVKPLAVMAGDGVLLMRLPAPAGMHWPAYNMHEGTLPLRIALEQGARPVLEGGGVRLDWLDRRPALEFVGRLPGKIPPRLRLRYLSLAGRSPPWCRSSAWRSARASPPRCANSCAGRRWTG